MIEADLWGDAATECGERVRTAVREYVELIVKSGSTGDQQAHIASARVALGLIAEGAKMLLSVMPRDAVALNAQRHIEQTLEHAMTSKMNRNGGPQG